MSSISQLDNPENFSEAAIFSRVVERSGGLSRELAEHILSLAFSQSDQERVSALLAKNVDSSLTPIERNELENLNHIADLLSLWHSRARQALSAM